MLIRNVDAQVLLGVIAVRRSCVEHHENGPHGTEEVFIGAWYVSCSLFSAAQSSQAFQILSKAGDNTNCGWCAIDEGRSSAGDLGDAAFRHRRVAPRVTGRVVIGLPDIDMLRMERSLARERPQSRRSLHPQRLRGCSTCCFLATGLVGSSPQGFDVYGLITYVL